MLLPIIGVLSGLILGLIFGSALPVAFAKYLSVIAISAFDSMLECGKNLLEDKYDNSLLLYSFLAASLLSCLLVFFGDKAGLDLYLVAVIALGVRIFQNLNRVIALLIERKKNKKFISSGSHFTEE